MNVFYSKNSLKYLSKLEKDIRTNIIIAIDKLPGEGDVKKMHGQAIKNIYRLRVGKFRILFHWKADTIKILDVDTRGDIYK